MQGLTEAMVIASRCSQWEEALLKQKVQMSEAAQANQRLTTAINEVTLDRDRVVGEMSSLRVEMAAKEEELRRALNDKKSLEERLMTLSSQLESVKTTAVEEFKSSEAFDDNNTKYFLAGFSLLKRQAKEKYPDLDFDAFQPFEDDESVIPVDGGNEGTTSADPQMDDDATS
jgi:predicted nuclease with TOPRIM domain